MLPIVILDQICSFDRDELIKSHSGDRRRFLVFPRKSGRGERSSLSVSLDGDLVLKMTIEESVGGKITKGAMESPSVVGGLEAIEKRSGGGAFGVEGEAVAEDFRFKGSQKALSEKALSQQ
jgi:hypothetical protein